MYTRTSTDTHYKHVCIVYHAYFFQIIHIPAGVSVCVLILDALCEQFYSLTSKMKGTLNFFATTIHVYSLIVLFLLIICVFAAFLDAVISVGGEAAFVSFSINLEKVMIEKVVFIY